MKTITVNVPDGIYDRLERAAKAASGTVTNQVIEVLGGWHPPTTARSSASLRNRRAPHDARGPVLSLNSDDDLLAEMLDDSRD